MMTERGWNLLHLAVVCALLWALEPARAHDVAQRPAVAISDRPWAQLREAEQQALAPLQKAWPQLTPAQRSKWLTLSGTFASLNPEERALVHARMADWAALSPQARARARLQYSHLQAISREERKARWEAYQALSTEEKRRLQRRYAAPNSAAPASRPSPARAERLVLPPSLNRSPAAAVPLDRKTLLPRQQTDKTSATENTGTATAADLPAPAALPPGEPPASAPPSAITDNSLGPAPASAAATQP